MEKKKKKASGLLGRIGGEFSALASKVLEGGSGYSSVSGARRDIARRDKLNKRTRK